MSLNQFIYRVSRPIGGLRVARYLARNHPRILMYHRISEMGSLGTISVNEFYAQMKLVRNSFNPISLSELLSNQDDGSIPEHSVVITFDDGYYDFSEYAFPILKELNIPATLFITTGFTNGDLWLWPDQLKYAIDKKSIDGPINIPGISETLHADKNPSYVWNRIADYCLTLPNEKKLKLIDNLFYQTGVEKPDSAPSYYRSLSWGEIKSMICDGLEVGCHSHSHPILTQLNDEELLHELMISKNMLKENLGVDSSVFCYPNGQSTDFDNRVKDAVKNAGYQHAIAAFPSDSPLKDRWSINRYPVSSSLQVFEKTVYGMAYLSMNNKLEILRCFSL